MALTSNDKSFVRGSTVHLRARVSEPGGKRPVSASVVLTALRRGATPVTVDTTTFTEEAVGDYSLVVPTADLDPGAYSVVITVSDGPSKVSVLTDSFVVTQA